MSEKINITVLVAPLDWGLGHATRCIPLINQLLQSGCNVIIAAEGKQENLLKTEFPLLKFVHLHGYRIRYANNKHFFLLKIIFQIPKIIKAIRSENKWLRSFIEENNVQVIISDNRYGLYHQSITSIFITHQLNIKAPFIFAERFLRNFNYHFIEKFSRCWIPDFKGKPNIAGILSNPEKLPAIPTTYIGGLSRLHENDKGFKKYKLLIVLTGPEPQRTVLEKTILKQISSVDYPVLLVRGLPGSKETLHAPQRVEIANHLKAADLETAFLESEYIISRSGYTTVMDICKLQKKSILIPTPGQTEQEYLATHLHQQGWCFAARQEDFSLSGTLKEAAHFLFQLPQLNMELYKEIIDELIVELKQKQTENSLLSV